jgi:(S)-ureidoglycine aminohydrolase
MRPLGRTRASYRRDHLLHTPDTFVRAPLPGMERASAIVHAAPAMGAAFTQYTVELQAGGGFSVREPQSFIYVLEGDLSCNGTILGRDAYAWFPPGCGVQVAAAEPARAIVIEKLYRPLNGAVPSALTGNALQTEPEPLLGDEAIAVRRLLPDLPTFDCAVNTMTFQPGAALPMVEIHVMEHGLIMLEGEGIYRLGESWYPVKAGDFIWMAPFCPQWFCAIGKVPARYLIYKDWNRHPLRTAGEIS